MKTSVQNTQNFLKENETKELLRFITCGSVDDGKSTLIGRLLHDSKNVYSDQLASAKRDSKDKDEVDLSLLVDGLQSEREQGITIDVAYRYFQTNKRKFIIADTPGHEQYTRNMATGASNADLAIILIDARNGVKTQTKRHSFVVKLLGIKHLVIAINKMDLVDYSQEVFEDIKKQYLKFLNELDYEVDISFIPICALKGDNIVHKSQNLPWYDGLSVISYLESVKINNDIDKEHFILPIQYVNRDSKSDFRGYCGMIACGSVNVGDEIIVLPSNKSSKVSKIISFGKEVTTANPKESVTICLKDEIDISRGDVFVKKDSHVELGNSFDANLIWMNEKEHTGKNGYLFKSYSLSTNAYIEDIRFSIDVNTFEKMLHNTLKLNEIAKVKISLDKNIVFTEYKKSKVMGSFILIDKITNETLAAGMILNKSFQKRTQEYSQYEIDLNAYIRKHFPHWEAKEIV